MFTPLPLCTEKKKKIKKSTIRSQPHQSPDISHYPATRTLVPAPRGKQKCDAGGRDGFVPQKLQMVL